MVESSPTGGVKPFPIAGRMARERERLLGMSDEERAWRKQWMKDQELTKNEPVHVPQYWLERTNPIRRFYQFPLNVLEKVTSPVLGADNAFYLRFWTGRIVVSIAAAYAGYYYFKYHSNDWTRAKGWRVIHSRKACVPGDEGYPKLSDRTKPSDYAARGFNESVI